MKKFAIASLIALAATAASATEVGVTVNRDYAGENRDGGGITIGQKYGSVGVTAGFDRATGGSNNQDRYTLTGSYNVAKVGPATVAVTGGAAYLSNQASSDGYALTVGAGVSVPVTKSIAATADYTRQYGQSRVNMFDGNRVAVGLKYAF